MICWPVSARVGNVKNKDPSHYQIKYERAADCLTKDRDALLAFYDFPAEHWKHLRTTNPIESTFATVRHRTIRSKGCFSNKTALAMVFKLVDGAEKNWRRIDGHNQLPKLIQGVRFTDGIEVGNCRPSSPSPRLILQAVTKIRRYLLDTSRIMSNQCSGAAHLKRKVPPGCRAEQHIPQEET
jgi:hypothetical protein